MQEYGMIPSENEKNGIFTTNQEISGDGTSFGTNNTITKIWHSIKIMKLIGNFQPEDEYLESRFTLYIPELKCWMTEAKAINENIITTNISAIERF